MLIALPLHLLSAVIWVGGMFFAYMALRPVAGELLEPPLRLTLWRQVLGKFFVWVTIAIVVLLVTGYWMIFGFFGGMKNVGPHVHIMMLLGFIMFALYGHLFFAPFKRLKKAVAEENWPEGGKQLNTMRKFIAINLVLGLLVTVIGSAGRFI